ncbi:hypothetical protein VOLCADRAFT_107296 [Volvox carteri f. nagariensis]|uniref:Glycosyltransferase family 28 N-terminal domain-containing protein n=1 Tax=Volvox carteri f. nagariensis TaxID=3068 RepID=D8UD22_VOLCA|nr:uncharacterized protein VOLCADRAFT_107296 [Volvox carteri f. nagariensis]EFJ42355.1 hypothetical protein VOLCADRAFT_107296 [Volvox carteri f. nagariensis]|eukprot:XP_002956588.1 hypothetical protein VOLCADRAFT_107296 [Volvox carteri f. nagariensis]
MDLRAQVRNYNMTLSNNKTPPPIKTEGKTENQHVKSLQSLSNGNEVPYDATLRTVIHEGSRTPKLPPRQTQKHPYLRLPIWPHQRQRQHQRQLGVPGRGREPEQIHVRQGPPSAPSSATSATSASPRWGSGNRGTSTTPPGGSLTEEVGGCDDGGDRRGGGSCGGGGGTVVSFDECIRKYGNVPSLRVLIMVAGTRGDVQPATALGVRLASHGHRVRLATHPPYRDLVYGAGLEFFPLAGDPRRMMELTVKHRAPRRPERVFRCGILP